MQCEVFRQWLDQWLDNELDAEQRDAFRKHAEQCPECGEQLRAAEHVRSVLSQMAVEADVPLKAQAAWRSAVRTASRKRMLRRIYRAGAAAAAVLVITIGITLTLPRSSDSQNSMAKANLVGAVSRVEADGGAAEEFELAYDSVESASAAAMYASKGAAVQVQNCTVDASDPETACAMLRNLVEEYEGTIEEETVNDAGTVLLLSVPEENSEEFVRAVSGVEGTVEFEETDWAKPCSFCIVIRQA